tara:strand:+ start:169 stop:819 length:651 start_codon:yes stop_codon:yes gene_type:complete
MKALIHKMDKKVLIGALAYICLLACVITLAACGGNSSDQQTIDSDVIPTVTAAAEISDGQIQLEIDSEQGTLQGSESAQTISEADVIDEVSNTEVMEMDSIETLGTPTPGAGTPTAAPEEFATATPLATPTAIGTATSTPIPAATATAFATPTIVGEGTPTPFPTPTEVVQATATPTPFGTATPFATPTPYEEPTPAGTATPFATATSIATPTPIN